MQVRRHRKQYRERRADMLLPVISLVGYTNAGACIHGRCGLTGLKAAVLAPTHDQLMHREEHAAEPADRCWRAG